MSTSIEIEQFLDVIRILRGPEGCPWDRKQTHESLKPFAIEETAEFLDEVDAKNSKGMCDELGDMLLQIVLHSTIAEENGEFTFNDVVRGIREKMIRRHPHVFGDEKVSHADEVLGVWQKMKLAEGAKPKSVIGKKSFHYPALLRVHEMTALAGKYGFDWPTPESVMDKISEEWAELQEAFEEGDDHHIDEEIGDLLFVIVNLARVRKRGHAEALLQGAIRKFESRFAHIEAQVAQAGKTLEQCTLEEMDAHWDDAKRIERLKKS